MLSCEPRITNHKPKRIYFLVGPTAVGKSQIAVWLAKKMNAEIISCDSMQIYKGMSIVTSWPCRSILKAVPHHLIGLVDAGKNYNVSRYRRQALEKIKDITARGKRPLLVGGSGLYVSILIDGIFKSPAHSPAIRQKLYKQAERFGSVYLHDKLKKADPQAALKIHPNDAKRIIRALEVFYKTGKPISELQKQRRGLSDEYALNMFCVNMPKDLLYERIGQRVDSMFRHGLLKQVKNLLKAKLGTTASMAIGISEVRGYVNGEYDLAEAKRLMKRNTCLYAKRQLTWFRKDRRIKWIDVNASEKPKETALRIWKEYCLLQ